MGQSLGNMKICEPVLLRCLWSINEWTAVTISYQGMNFHVLFFCIICLLLCVTQPCLLHILVIRSDIFFLYSQMFSPDFLFLNKPAILTLLAVPLPVGDSQCTPVHGALHNSKHQQSRVQVAEVQAVHSW